jgi:hypothetical protein
MISISPESQVYPVSKTNFCQSAPNTGTVKLMGSYSGVSYQLKNAADNSNVQSPKIGTGNALTWTDLQQELTMFMEQVLLPHIVQVVLQTLQY